MADGESEVADVANGEAGFGHLTTAKKSTVAGGGLALIGLLAGNVYQGVGDARDATSLAEIQTGLTHVIEIMDDRHTRLATQCMFLLAGEELPPTPIIVTPIPTPSAPRDSDVQ